MLVRDEMDIIEQNLRHVLEWADTLTIFDTGSTDGTWEFINEIARNDSRINALEHASVVYGNPLRAYLFERVRSDFEEGDWVVKVDVDEFFHISPPQFVDTCLRKPESCVWLQWYFFRLTSDEVYDYESGAVDLRADRQRPIEERRRYYEIPRHSEPRMFRYRPAMKWSVQASFPHHAGFIARERIPIRHYPHRDPLQMEQRYRLRALMKRRGSPAGPHWLCDDWRTDVIICGADPANSTEQPDTGQGLSSVPGHTTGDLLYWGVGTKLPRVKYLDHLRPQPIRFARFVLNRWLLPIADRLQKGFDPALKPRLISETVAGISKEIRKKTKSAAAFHGLLVIRDEDDIIKECLNHLLTWADAIYVLDLGSTDETWAIVRELASRERRVVPFRSQSVVFSETIRGYVFEQYRDRFRDGDWVLRLDADEFYHINPREFVSERISPAETCVYLGWYYFRLTTLECEAYESGRLDLTSDRKRPIIERRRFYKMPDHAEPRMFRYRSNMKWSGTASFPNHAGFIARERIPIRHYPHRDPVQMKKRYKLRSQMMKLNGSAGPHWCLEDWRKDVIDYDPTSFKATERTEATEGLSAAKGHTFGPLHYWDAGEPLPPLVGSQHLGGWTKRTVQRVIHPALLPVLDSFRPGWEKKFNPSGFDER
jgi:glycosyltransferase involved in cell wall biosynthesis